MRAILLVLILAVVALIAAIATGYLDIDQTRPAEVPDIDAGSGGVSASGGQVPTFDIETGSVSVGASERGVSVPLPTVEVTPAEGEGGNEAEPEPPAE